MMVFDQTDVRILERLQANGRITQVDIAREVGLAPSAVLERIRKLEARGVIRGYAALVNPSAAGLGMLAFVAVQSTEAPGEDGVGRELSTIPEVLEVHHVAGDDCYLLKVRARDAEHLGQILRQQISAVPAVTSTRTTIVLETVKEDPRVSIPKDKTLPELQR
jgi:Lrp/AsnC family leucine-responsive transcriptional regulator